MLNMTADPETHTKRTPSTFQFLKRKHRYDCFTCSSDMHPQSLKTENAAIAKSENTCHSLCTAVAIPYLSAVAADQKMGKKKILAKVKIPARSSACLPLGIQ